MLCPQTGREKQELSCNFCQASFPKTSNMHDHVRTHLNIRLFKCSICDKGFSWIQNRNRHEKKAACLTKYEKISYLSAAKMRKKSGFKQCKP